MQTECMTRINRVLRGVTLVVLVLRSEHCSFHLIPPEKKLYTALSCACTHMVIWSGFENANLVLAWWLVSQFLSFSWYPFFFDTMKTIIPPFAYQDHTYLFSLPLSCGETWPIRPGLAGSKFCIEEILLITPCLLTRIREFSTRSIAIPRGRRQRVVLRC